MKVTTLALCATALCGSTASAVSTRGSGKHMTRSNVQSFALWSWGPQSRNTDADVIFLDYTQTSESEMKKLRDSGKILACYISAGTLESFRNDKDSFNTDELAKKYRGFGGHETWFDITKWEELKKPMGDRIDEAKSKGCNAIEFDNIDCYANNCVKGASYDELKNKQIQYVKWLASTTHSLGMDVGMKNGVEIMDNVVSDMDFAINEECQKYSECHYYSNFVNHNKVAFGVEYDGNGGNVCSEAKQAKMITMYRSGGWHDCF